MKPYIKQSSTTTLFIAPWLICGGADRCLIDMAEAIHAEYANHKSVLITLRKHRNGNPWVKNMPDGTEHYDLAALSEDGQVVQDMLDLIREIQPDRIVCSNGHEFIGALDSVRWAAPKADISILIHMHLPGEWNFVPDLLKYQEFYDTLFTVSKKLAESCIESGISSDRVQPLRWFGFKELGQVVSTDAVRRRFKVPDGKQFVLWPFRIEDQKRPELVVPTAGFLKNRNPDVHHVIAGDGSRRRWLEQCCKDAALEDIVHFIGPIDNSQMQHALNACMCVATLSRDEGIPLVYFESLQMGKPVICTDVGAVSELITNKTGRAINPDLEEREIAREAASVIAGLSISSELRDAAKEECLSRISGFTYESWRGDLIGRINSVKLTGGHGIRPHNPPTKKKVFIIGAPKTGTSSVGMALRHLGMHDLGHSPILQDYYHMSNFPPIWDAIGAYDCFSDGPFNTGDFYMILSKRYPDAKFILTQRPILDWIKSFKAHFAPGGENIRIAERYRFHSMIEQRWLEWYQERNARIIKFFKDEPDRLTIINIGSDQDHVIWRKLCNIVGVKGTPEIPFPVLNATKRPE